MNTIILSLFIIIFLFSVGFISYKITNSYALFTDEVTGVKTIEATVKLSNLDTSGANEPVLDSSMIPVYYDESSSSWRKADVKNHNDKYKWYDYDNKMWANSVTVSETNRSKYLSANLGTEIPMDDILTMEVWIPRYKYKVFNYNSDGTKTSSPQQIEITFEKDNKNTSEITCSDSISGTDGKASEACKLKSTNATCTDSLCNNKNYTHPAFTFGNEEIKGFWIGKFELTGTISSITTKPNLSSIRNQSVSTFETNIMNMKNIGNQYGLNTTTDTHMIKNSEWGAVAYLSHSKYGTCTSGSCTEIGINNNSNFITGCGSSPSSSSSATCNSYNRSKGMLASTTFNIYGVYDMSGGAVDYVMGNMIYLDKTIMISGFALDRNSGYTGEVPYVKASNETLSWSLFSGVTYPEKKYYNIYSYGSNAKNSTKLGDAVKEVQTGTNVGWYSVFNYSLEKQRPWFRRGGGYSGGNSTGIFYAGYEYGSALDGASTRFIISD